MADTSNTSGRPKISRNDLLNELTRLAGTLDKHQHSQT